MHQVTLLLDLGAKLGRASFFLILQFRNKVLISPVQCICPHQLIFENHVPDLSQCKVKQISLNCCLNCRIFGINYNIV